MGNAFCFIRLQSYWGLVAASANCVLLAGCHPLTTQSSPTRTAVAVMSVERFKSPKSAGSKHQRMPGHPRARTQSLLRLSNLLRRVHSKPLSWAALRPVHQKKHLKGGESRSKKKRLNKERHVSKEARLNKKCLSRPRGSERGAVSATTAASAPPPAPPLEPFKLRLFLASVHRNPGSTLPMKSLYFRSSSVWAVANLIFFENFAGFQDSRKRSN